MSEKNLGSQVLLASATNTMDEKGFTKAELAETNMALQELAKKAAHGEPNAKYEIAQIVSVTVNDILDLNEAQALGTLADVRNIAEGASAEFKVNRNEITAYTQAVGGTPYRSKVFSDSIPLQVQEISARPYANYAEMATGRVNFTDLIQSAARSMTLEKIKLLEETLKANVANLPAEVTASGAALVKDTFNELYFKFRRMGATRIVGDISLLNQLSEFSGYNGADRPSDVASEEIRNQAYVGTYLGASVHELINPPVDSTMDPILTYNALFILAGNESPLKFINQGGVRAQERQNFEDGSFEMILRQNVAAGFVYGRVPTMGVYTIV